MNLRSTLVWMALLTLGLLPEVSAQAPAARPAAADTPKPRQFAAAREVDIEHLALDITPDFRQRTIAGEAVLRFRVLTRPLTTLRLDAVDLNVTHIKTKTPPSGWEVTDDAVLVHFAPPLAPGTAGWVRIDYTAEPKEGLYFRTPELGYAAEDEHMWSQGQAISARHWYPSFDAPNDKFTTEVTCRVPPGMVVLSNGRKTAEVITNGLLAVTWMQDQPHVNYLVALVAGHFRKLEDRHRDIPLGFWTLPSDATNAARSFEGTKDMMAFFEEFTGTPYPWPKYDQVCVEDFVAGGMENTTLTVLQNGTLFPAGFGEIRTSQGLIAHELAHQWFGDFVTCKDWANIWLNEGFATFFEFLYDEHKHGRDQYLLRLHDARAGLTERADDTRPIVFRGYEDPDEMFDHHAYARGAWTLNMLRRELGEEDFRRVVKLYLERHAYGSVTTDDLAKAVEEVTGRPYDWFFDQWVYRGGRPELEVDYAWDEAAQLARVSVRQIQPVSEQAPVFRLPLTLRFQLKDGAVDRRAEVTKASEDFMFALPERPAWVRVDPDYALLARINFHPPAPMLAAQIKAKNDALGRLEAVEQLASRRDHEAVAMLKDRLQNDPFHGVRIAASQSLRVIHNDEALEALLASGQQPEARVRRQVVADLGAFNQDSARAALLKVVSGEQNPDIVAEALRGLDAWRDAEVRDLLLKQLGGQSYEQLLANAALRGLRGLDDPATFAPVFAMLQQREAQLPTQVLATGLDTVAWLARDQDDKTGVREFIIRQTGSPRRRLRLAAINALGTLGDPRAVPVLENFAKAEKNSPERRGAERAIEAIRSPRKPQVELGSLRQEMRDVQKENRALKQNLEQLQKKVDALSTPPPKPATKPPRR